MIRPAGTLALIAAPLSLLATANAFQFQTTAPQQCGEWTVEWDGGTAPFFLMLVPTTELTAGRIMNISMPAEGSPPYRHTFTLPEPGGLEMVATMYDADGFGSGGATDVLTVGDSANSSCLNSDVKADFYFWTEPVTNPAQCGSMAFTWNEDAYNPVGLHGIVLGGTAFNVPVPNDAHSRRTFNWTVNIEAGADVILIMSDAGPYGTGGSTKPLRVQDSSDVTCIDENSPHTTSVPPPLATSTLGSSSTLSTGSKTSSPSPTATDTTPPSPSTSTHDEGAAAADTKKSNIGTIVGAAVGVSVAVILAILVALCLCRRKRKQVVDESEKLQPNGQQFLTVPFAPLQATEPVQADSTNPRQSVLRRLTASGRNSTLHMRMGSRGTLNGVMESRGRDVSGAIAGLPNGASPPSILTDDSGSEHFELSPFPYEDSPPGFHTLGINTNVSGDTKMPPTAASAAPMPIDGYNNNPFGDPPSPRTTTDTTPLHTGEKGGWRYSSPVVRQQTLRTQTDILRMSNISHDQLVAAPPTTRSAPLSTQGAVADNVSDHEWNAATHDPPPQYNMYDRLRAANPDPSDASSIGGSSGRQ